MTGKSFDVELKDIADKWEITGTLPSWLSFEQISPLNGRFTCGDKPEEGTFTIFMSLSNSKGIKEYNFTLNIASDTKNNGGGNNNGGANNNSYNNNTNGNNNGVRNNTENNNNDSKNNDSKNDDENNGNENNNGGNGDNGNGNNNAPGDNNNEDNNENNNYDNENNSEMNDDEKDNALSGCDVNSGSPLGLIICLAPMLIKKFKI